MVIFSPELDGLCRRQFGLATTRQLIAAGVSSSTISRLAETGRLIRVGHGVYRMAGAPVSWRQRALAACLAAPQPAVCSHLAAAGLWEAPSILRPPVELTVLPGHRCSTPGVRVHRLPLPPIDRTVRHRTPVTTPARTAIDLCGVVPPTLHLCVIDDLLRARHLRIADIDRRLADPAPLPRHQAGMLAVLLDRRRGRRPGNSPREDWVIDAIRDAGLPVPEREHQVLIRGQVRLLDAAYPHEKVAIEYDGWRDHTLVSHRHRDSETLIDLELEGWIVIRVTSAWTERDLVDRVGRALEHQRQRYGLVGQSS